MDATTELLSSSYDVVLLLVAIYAAWRFRQLNLPGKLVCLLIWNGFLTERIAMLTSYYYGTNMPAYTVATYTEYFIICLFFNYTLSGFAKKNIGIYLGIVGVLLGIGNTIYIQPLSSINSNFIFLSCLILICLTLYLTFRMLIAMDVVPSREVHFWFSIIMLFFYCSTLWIWAIYDYVFVAGSEADKQLVANWLMGVGHIVYPAYAILLYRYPKLKRSYV